ncbi:MAG: hypothetical protein F4Z77_10760 [Dehalococcoidia bacterium]|nr:hypothetical protein [Chloroflexota bacterium]MXW26755.1 hypothetical protein [Dehalococcoidia bacterium]MXZ87407.1 hypothetical protein [Dehalococcoidia bacterium]MYA52227.1 hypothetical protein [Dehalococcoidia bacterium]MYI85537.1 hypothetical protein [Dehalococcoidia bacterium]
MANPVTDTVFFTVHVHSRERGDHWMTKTVETGLISYGDTREEAEAKNGEANVLLVRRAKREGMAYLSQFMQERGLEFVIGGEPGETREAGWRYATISNEPRPLAA